MRRAALFLLAVLIAGCGGSKDTTFHTDAATFSRALTAATGVQLRSTKTQAGDTRLEEEPTNTPRFGFGFSIDIVADAKARDRVLSDFNGRVAPRSSDGLYHPGVGSVVKDYGNGVLLEVQTRDGTAFAGLDAAIRAVLAGRASRLPAGDRPCAAVGIDLVSGREGSCRDAGSRATVADAGHPATAGTTRATLVGAGTITTIPMLAERYHRTTATGRYLLVRVRLDNTGHTPLERTVPSLEVDGRTYHESGDAQIELTGGRELAAFPVQPGGSVTLTTVFSLTTDVAGAALEKGLLRYRSGYDDNGGSTTAVLRLAGAKPTTVAAARLYQDRG